MPYLIETVASSLGFLYPGAYIHLALHSLGHCRDALCMLAPLAGAPSCVPGCKQAHSAACTFLPPAALAPNITATQATRLQPLQRVLNSTHLLPLGAWLQLGQQEHEADFTPLASPEAEGVCGFDIKSPR